MTVSDAAVDAQASRLAYRLGRIDALANYAETRGVAWSRRALCDSTEGDWFTISGGNLNAKRYDKRVELAICDVCPVKASCLDAGMTERFGIWGGLLPSERAKLSPTSTVRQRARGYA